MKKIYVLVFVFSLSLSIKAQEHQPTSADERVQSFDVRTSLKESSLVKDVEFRKETVDPNKSRNFIRRLLQLPETPVLNHQSGHP